MRVVASLLSILIAVPNLWAAPKINQKYLMSFFACDTSTQTCTEPNGHYTYLAQSNDGATWSLISQFTAINSSVPDLVRRKTKVKGVDVDKIYVYFAGNQMVKVNPKSGKHGLIKNVLVSGFGSNISYVDPSAYQSKGKIYLAFLYCTVAGTVGNCFPDTADTKHIIGLASEVKNSDGTKFKFQKDLIDLTAEGLSQGTDPDLFYDGHQFVVYVSSGPSIAVFTSSKLIGDFTRASIPSDNYLSSGSGSVPSGYYDKANSKYWTYVHASSGTASINNIQRAVHSDYSTQLTSSNFTPVITASSLGLSATNTVESPGFCINK